LSSLAPSYSFISFHSFVCRQELSSSSLVLCHCCLVFCQRSFITMPQLYIVFFFCTMMVLPWGALASHHHHQQHHDYVIILSDETKRFLCGYIFHLVLCKDMHVRVGHSHIVCDMVLECLKTEFLQFWYGPNIKIINYAHYRYHEAFTSFGIWSFRPESGLWSKYGMHIHVSSRLQTMVRYSTKLCYTCF
jgi:hypothetical protein